MNIKDTVQRVRYFLSTLNTQTLIIIPIVAGFCCFGLLVVNGQVYSGTPAQNFWIMVGSLFWAISGIPKIVRQESSYGPLHLEGPLAIVDGIITIVLCLFLASLPLIVWGR